MLKYLVNKKMLGGTICRCLLLFLEFDFEVIVKMGRLNSGPYHLSRIKSGEELGNIDDSLPNAQLFVITLFDDYYRDIIQFFTMGYVVTEFTSAQKKQLVMQAADLQLIAR